MTLRLLTLPICSRFVTGFSGTTKSWLASILRISWKLGQNELVFMSKSFGPQSSHPLSLKYSMKDPPSETAQRSIEPPLRRLSQCCLAWILVSRRTLQLVEKARGKNGVPPAFPQVLPSCVCSICLGHQKTLFVIAPVFKTNNYPNLGTKMNQV